MKVSVVIPLFNAEKYLAACLESLLIQTLKDFEVILVDDCSTDNSIALAESYVEKFGGRLKIIALEKNTGSGAAPRNIGAELASGKYVYFMDNDDLLIDIALEELFNSAEAYQADVVCMNQFFSCDENPFPKKIDALTWDSEFVSEEMTLTTENFAERSKKFLEGRLCVAPWSKFLRRDFLASNKIKFLSMTIAEDVIWTFELIYLAKVYLRMPQPLYIYRDNNRSIMRKGRSPEQILNFRIDPMITGIDYLNNFMQRHNLLKENPELCFQVLNFFAEANLKDMANATQYLNPVEAYEIFLREFSKAGSSQPALIAYLFVMNNLYRNELAGCRNARRFEEFKPK